MVTVHVWKKCWNDNPSNNEDNSSNEDNTKADRDTNDEEEIDSKDDVCYTNFFNCLFWDNENTEFELFKYVPLEPTPKSPKVHCNLLLINLL